MNFASREPKGSRLHVWLMAAAVMLSLPSCALLPPQNYALNTLPLTPDQGWVLLPTARWLLNPGIEPDALMFCAAQTCGEQGFVARIRLAGPERAFAVWLARDPAKALAAARPTRTAQAIPARARGRTLVTPVTIGEWRGGLVALEARRHSGRTAHVVIVGRDSGDTATLLMTVGATSEAAIQQARRALD